jgi:uncharacterized protein (DUF58 family)
MWGGFAIVWETLAISNGGGVFFALWGVPFVGFGLYLMVGRFFYKARVKRRTWFAVTNRRVLKLVRRKDDDEVAALFLDSIPVVNRHVDPDGSGSVVFGSGNRWQAELAPISFASNAEVPLAFYDIPDAGHVAELITQLRQGRPDR